MIFVLNIRQFFVLVFTLHVCSVVAQTTSETPSTIQDYKDSTYRNFYKQRFKVAKSQINLLKTNGALLVRLKTNANTINKLKTAGNIDLATQVERETFINNKNIVRAYTQEFKFCPVYFFYSSYSDSVKHKNISSIFLDTNLIINPSIVCDKAFYLIAEQGSVVNSSLGLVSESQASKAIETGTEIKTVFAIIKNRYYIQLHKPFPYFQKGMGNKLKNYKDCVKKLNAQFTEFYSKNANYIIEADIKDFVY